MGTHLTSHRQQNSNKIDSFFNSRPRFLGPKAFWPHATTTRLYTYTVNRIAEIMAYLVLLAEFGQTKLERTRQ